MLVEVVRPLYCSVAVVYAFLAQAVSWFSTYLIRKLFLLDSFLIWCIVCSCFFISCTTSCLCEHLFSFLWNDCFAWLKPDRVFSKQFWPPWNTTVNFLNCAPKQNRLERLERKQIQVSKMRKLPGLHAYRLRREHFLLLLVLRLVPRKKSRSSSIDSCWFGQISCWYE